VGIKILGREAAPSLLTQARIFPWPRAARRDEPPMRSAKMRKVSGAVSPPRLLRGNSLCARLAPSSGAPGSHGILRTRSDSSYEQA